MSADATPGTPTDPRAAGRKIARDAARAYVKTIEQDHWASRSLAVNVAVAVFDALTEAGLLALPERVAQDAEQVAVAALDRMGASPAWRDADARAIVRDLRAAGLLRVPPEGEGSLRSQASGTPAETGQVRP